MKILTKFQTSVLEVVTQSSRGCARIDDIAFELETSPGAVGRAVRVLSAQGLVYNSLGRI